MTTAASSKVRAVTGFWIFFGSGLGLRTPGGPDHFQAVVSFSPSFPLFSHFRYSASIVDYLFSQSAISDRKNRTNFEPIFRARRLPRCTSPSINRRDVPTHSASSSAVCGRSGMSSKFLVVFRCASQAWAQPGTCTECRVVDTELRTVVYYRTECVGAAGRPLKPKSPNMRVQFGPDRFSSLVSRFSSGSNEIGSNNMGLFAAPPTCALICASKTARCKIAASFTSFL